MVNARPLIHEDGPHLHAADATGGIHLVEQQFRRLPPRRGFLVAAGLAEALAFLETFSFDDDELGYLRDVVGLDQPTVAALAGLRFTGDVRAVPEGRVVFADEPLVEVTAPIAEASEAK